MVSEFKMASEISWRSRKGTALVLNILGSAPYLACGNGSIIFQFRYYKCIAMLVSRDTFTHYLNIKFYMEAALNLRYLGFVCSLKNFAAVGL